MHAEAKAKTLEISESGLMRLADQALFDEHLRSIGQDLIRSGWRGGEWVMAMYSAVLFMLLAEGEWDENELQKGRAWMKPSAPPPFEKEGLMDFARRHSGLVHRLLLRAYPEKPEGV